MRVADLRVGDEVYHAPTRTTIPVEALPTDESMFGTGTIWGVGKYLLTDEALGKWCVVRRGDTILSRPWGDVESFRGAAKALRAHLSGPALFGGEA